MSSEETEDVHGEKRLEVAAPQGKEVFLKLAQNCDIVADNFWPGTMERFGFDHESLAKLNPKIIALSSTAYLTLLGCAGSALL